MNHQRLLCCVATVVLRKQLNFKSAVIRSNRSSCYSRPTFKLNASRKQTAVYKCPRDGKQTAAQGDYPLPCHKVLANFISYMANDRQENTARRRPYAGVEVKPKAGENSLNHREQQIFKKIHIFDKKVWQSIDKGYLEATERYVIYSPTA